MTATTQTQATDWRRLLGLREMGVYYALILLVLVISAVTVYTGRPSYLSVANISNVLYQASLVAIIAVAMTVILITGNFDLSVASVAALSAAVVVGLADTVGFWPAALIAMLVSVLAGLLNGAIVQYLGINAFIVTLGTLTAIRGVVQIYTDGRSLSVERPTPCRRCGSLNRVDCLSPFRSSSSARRCCWRDATSWFARAANRAMSR